MVYVIYGLCEGIISLNSDLTRGKAISREGELKPIYQASFDYVKVCPTPFLAYCNL